MGCLKPSTLVHGDGVIFVASEAWVLGNSEPQRFRE